MITKLSLVIDIMDGHVWNQANSKEKEHLSQL